MPVKLESMRDALLKGLWATGTGQKPHGRPGEFDGMSADQLKEYIETQLTGGVSLDKKQKMSASGEFTLDEIEEARKFMYKCNQS